MNAQPARHSGLTTQNSRLAPPGGPPVHGWGRDDRKVRERPTRATLKNSKLTTSPALRTALVRVRQVIATSEALAAPVATPTLQWTLQEVQRRIEGKKQHHRPAWHLQSSLKEGDEGG